MESSYFRGEEAKHLEEYRKVIPYLSILKASLMISKEDIRKELLSKLPDDLSEPIAQKYGMTQCN